MYCYKTKIKIKKFTEIDISNRKGIQIKHPNNITVWVQVDAQNKYLNAFLKRV